MIVPDDGGPFTATISQFVDSKGNPTTEEDIPVWATSDSTIATVSVDDPTTPQTATVTLTGTLGQAQITASFPGVDTGGHGPAYVVTGDLTVQAGAAVSATMTFSGPGIS